MQARLISVALLRTGQIDVGDTILCEYKGEPKQYTAKEVLYPGTKHEEVIIDFKRNAYFITTMAIDGTSWAKNVRILVV